MNLGGVCERWCIDLTGEHPLSHGKRFCFTAIDPFSKFAICVAIPDKKASTIAKAIVEHIILKWGLFFEVLTDRGMEFQAELVQELLKLLGIVRLRTTSYRAATNGVCENWHRQLHSLLAKVISEHQRDWSLWIDYITLAHKATIHLSIGYAPHYVMTGQEIKWNVDFLLNNLDECKKSVPEYTAELLDRLHTTHKLVRNHLKQAAESASTWYNKRVKSQTFYAGDKVRVYYPRHVKGRTPKWQSFFKTEAVIQTKLNDATYVVNSPSWKEPKIIHVDKLRPIIEFV